LGLATIYLAPDYFFHQMVSHHLVLPTKVFTVTSQCTCVPHSKLRIYSCEPKPTKAHILTDYIYMYRTASVRMLPTSISYIYHIYTSLGTFSLCNAVSRP